LGFARVPGQDGDAPLNRDFCHEFSAPGQAEKVRVPAVIAILLQEVTITA
jgi:hypothetical protein